MELTTEALLSITVSISQYNRHILFLLLSMRLSFCMRDINYVLALGTGADVYSEKWNSIHMIIT